jgi:hypothetical protein
VLEYLFRESPRCGRIIEIQKINTARLYGPRAAWKDVGQRLLDHGFLVCGAGDAALSTSQGSPLRQDLFLIASSGSLTNLYGPARFCVIALFQSYY